MKILQICADRGIPPDGTKGAAVHLRGLAAALARAGHEVTLYASRVPEDASSFPVPVAPLASLPRAAPAPDVVYERYALGHRGGLETARALGVPFVLEVNAPLVLEAKRHRPGSLRDGDEATERDVLRQADLVVTVSEPLRRYVAGVRDDDEGVVVVRNGSDPALYPEPASLSTTDGATLVFLGHPKPWHGADRLPAVVAALREQERDVRLLVVGGGAGAAVVRHAACEVGVEAYVEVTGALPASQAAGLVAGGTLAVAPYPLQPFFYFCPLKVLDSMMAGLPLVTTDQGDLGAILGGTGVLVTPDDLDAFTGAVAALLDDAAERARLGAAARRRALATFTWDAAAGALVRAAAPLVAQAAA